MNLQNCTRDSFLRNTGEPSSAAPCSWSGSGGALLRRRPLTTGHADHPASGSSHSSAPWCGTEQLAGPLEKLNAALGRKPLAKALKRSDGAKGGRPPFDAVMMFKVLVLQALCSLSDDQAEFQIQDRLSFMSFLGLGLGDKVLDAKTIWLFREHLT